MLIRKITTLIFSITAQVTLGQGNVFYSFPVISPDGKMLLYTSNPDGQANLFIRPIQGGTIIQLTDSPALDSHGYFSSESEWIYFSSDQQDAREIHRITPDGKQKEVVISDDHDHFSPALSKSNKLVWHAFADGKSKLMMLENDEVVELTDGSSSDSNPDWSPDEKKIVYESIREQNKDLYILDLETRETERLTFHSGEDLTPRWSADGERILFQSNRDGNDDIFLMDLGTKNITNLTQKKQPELMPNWHPDGDKIIFVRRSTYGFEIMLMRLKNRSTKRLIWNR